MTATHNPQIGNSQSRPHLLVSVLRRLMAAPFRLSLLGWEKDVHDVIRVGMYKTLAETLPGLLPQNVTQGEPEALCISGSWFLTRLAAPRSKVTDARYPEVDVLSLPYLDDTFDLVVTDQVLEHVGGDPFRAVEECRRVLKPGGIAIHATPFLIQIHGYPSDYWRFTPQALVLLCRNHGGVLASGSSGSRYLWLLSWLGLFEQRVPKASWHPYRKLALKNEPEFPSCTWIVARK